MNVLDVTVISIIISTTVLGLWKGMQRQVFGLGGVVAGYLAATKLYEPVAGVLGNDSSLAQIVSFISLFVLGKTGVSATGWLARNFMKTMSMTWINRTGGAVLGILKGFIMVMIIILSVLAFMPADSSLIKNSATLPYIASLPKITSGLIPGKIRSKYNDNVEKLQSQWRKTNSN